MRRYLGFILVAGFAGGILLAGCASTNRAAIERSLYVDKHPTLSEQMAEAILNGQIMVGMTEEMVQVAWGKPVRVEDVSEEEAAKHWIYGNYFVGGTITNLYFDPDGVLLRCEVKNQTSGATMSQAPMADSADKIKAGADGSLQKGSPIGP
jgi:hypothetical protein